MKDFQFLRPSSLAMNLHFAHYVQSTFQLLLVVCTTLKGMLSVTLTIRQWRLKKLQNRWVFSSRNQTINLSQLIMAENLFNNFVAEHNLPFVVADHFTQLCSKLFPDSKIASKFACKCTKCTQIIKRAIAPSLEDKVVQMCKKQPFSILCNESNDRGAEKCFAILVRVFDEISKKARTFFLDMPIVNIGTGENLFNVLDKCLR